MPASPAIELRNRDWFWSIGLANPLSKRIGQSDMRSMKIHYIDRRPNAPENDEDKEKMANVKVYNVSLYDITTDQIRLSGRMATRQGIAIMGGAILEDTETEIDEDELERGQQWTPIGFQPGCPDYAIKSDEQGNLGISAITPRAQTRAPGPPANSELTLVFRSRAELLQFINSGEADGFTFARKDLLR